jgi:hypothetical protein
LEELIGQLKAIPNLKKNQLVSNVPKKKWSPFLKPKFSLTAFRAALSFKTNIAIVEVSRKMNLDICGLNEVWNHEVIPGES